MRRGVPIATNMACQELAIMTGVLDAMVIDYQCIAPTAGWWAQCFHTKLISTMPITRIPTDLHIEFTESGAAEAAREIVRTAIDAYKQRNPALIHIPKFKNKVVAGFSLEAIKKILANFNSEQPLQYLADKLKDGTIKGIGLLAGCNNVKVKHDEAHIVVAQELLKNNIMVVATGCAAQAYAKHGFLSPEKTNELCGDSLKQMLTELGGKTDLAGPLPPILHMGACVDNSRVERMMAELADIMGVDMHELPIAASAPEAMTEKAAVIGTWAVATGWPTHVGVYAYHRGSDIITEIAEKTAKDVYGGFFIFEPDPHEGVRKMINVIKFRRWKLGIDTDEKDIIYWDGTKASEERKPISQKQLFKMAIDGSVIATGYADYLLNRAIRKYGRDKEIEYPDTGYFLPSIHAWHGEEVKTLGQLPKILGDVRRKIKEDEITFENAVASGEATMVSAEIVEALKYVEGEDPYKDTPYSGFVPDKVLRELGIAFVDDTIPGAIAIVGKAKDPEKLKKIIKDCQNKGMLLIPTFDIIKQLKDVGVEIGEQKGLDRMLFCVGEFTQAIHGLNFAIRAALAFGGKKPGDREAIYDYLKQRPKVVVLQLGPIDDIKAAAEFAVMFNGSPTVTDQDVEEIPGWYVVQKDYDQIVSTIIEVRNMVIKMGVCGSRRCSENTDL
jgi:hypothetical protein